MHLPHPDGDLPLADWQMFNNWGPKFKSNILEPNTVWITKRGKGFAAWPNVKACLSTLCIHSSNNTIHKCLLCSWWDARVFFSPYWFPNWTVCWCWWVCIYYVVVLLELSWKVLQLRVELLKLHSKQKLRQNLKQKASVQTGLRL